MDFISAPLGHGPGRSPHGSIRAGSATAKIELVETKARSAAVARQQLPGAKADLESAAANPICGSNSFKGTAA